MLNFCRRSFDMDEQKAQRVFFKLRPFLCVAPGGRVIWSPKRKPKPTFAAFINAYGIRVHMKEE